MEFGTIPTLSLVGMIFSIVVIIALVTVLIITGIKKHHAKISRFFIGGGTFIVFALVLERILHGIVFKVAPTLPNNIWLYGLYGALAAAVFEETGRIVAFKLFLKNDLELNSAFMYGVGHGGTEAILLGVLTCISNLATSIMINNGSFQATLQLLDSETANATFQQISQLWTLSSGYFFIIGIERLFAIILHIALTLFVFAGLKSKQPKYVLLAYAVHFAVDFVVVVSNKFVSIYVVEILMAVLSIAAFMLSHKIIKKIEQ